MSQSIGVIRIVDYVRIFNQIEVEKCISVCDTEIGDSVQNTIPNYLIFCSPLSNYKQFDISISFSIMYNVWKPTN